MYAITETEKTYETTIDLDADTYFHGHVCLGVYWDADWKLEWVEGVIGDVDGDEHRFEADSPVAKKVIQLLNKNLSFQRKANDWACDAIEEHRKESFYNYVEA